ncbi:ABC-2 type transport system ATP-binding protein [Rhodococcus sp. 27YEA15]|uniref:ABC transporter ATP-binding protein n=1 Tax=Rhodococcus sp. 27YEA15 TaxID=3156259 RepID=UPI003C7BBA33
MTPSVSGQFSVPTPAAPIEVRGLSKTFGTTDVVDDLSFDVPAGSVTVLLGPVGAGKTTILEIVLGLTTPTSGSATVAGSSIRALRSPARTVGAVLDSAGTHPRRTALDHLQIYATAIGMPPGRARHVLAMVGLASAGAHRSATFSPGMHRRLALATAMLGDPDILVLDEPTHGLDHVELTWLRRFLRTFADSGRTVLISSRAPREVDTIVDNVVMISAGTLVYQGSMNDLRRSRHSRLLVACSNPPLLATALAARGIVDAVATPDGRLAIGGTDVNGLLPVAAAAGVTIFEITDEKADLEHLFLTMTTGQHSRVPERPRTPDTGYFGPAAYGPSGGRR